MSSKVVERIPGWVERLLIPSLETRIGKIVKEEVGHLEKLMDVRFEAVNEKINSLEKATSMRMTSLETTSDTGVGGVTEKIASLETTVNTRFDSLERRFSVVEDLAEIKTRLAAVERKSSA